MQKMSPVASKLSELWQFLYTKVTWNLNFTKFLNLEISVNFRDRNPYPLRGRVNQVLIFWTQNVYWLFKHGPKNPTWNIGQIWSVIRGQLLSQQILHVQMSLRQMSIVKYGLRKLFLKLSHVKIWWDISVIEFLWL